MHGGGPGFESPRLHRGGRSSAPTRVTRCQRQRATLTTRHVDDRTGVDGRDRPWMRDRRGCPSARARTVCRTTRDCSVSRASTASDADGDVRQATGSTSLASCTDGGDWWRRGPAWRGAGTVRGWEQRMRGAIREDGRMVDALASAAEEGRGHAAKCPGEALAAGDPGVSEWGNPPRRTAGHLRVCAGGHRGN